MVQRSRMEAYLSDLLDRSEIADYAPNGLQVEGREEITTLISGVTASAALVEAACDLGADAILVHHGYFWKGEDPRVVGMKARRLQRLLGAGINLFAYHLPLDVHPEVGNNAGLARLLGIVTEMQHTAKGVPGLLWSGRLPAATDPHELAGRLERELGRPPTLVDGGGRAIQRIAWSTGGADGLIEQAAGLGVDAFISGEISEPTAHVARERGVCFFAAGHHATERSGVQAAGARVGEALGVEHRYVEIDNPA